MLMIDETVYRHRVQYYETDQMGIVHHSNYIRWFEEARLDWMRRRGVPYHEFERRGLVIPVTGVSASYHRMVHFEDVVAVTVTIEKLNSAVMEIAYQVLDACSGEKRCTGQSRHCFLNAAGKLVSLKKEAPDFYEILHRETVSA